jgi:hypothetical protein
MANDARTNRPNANPLGASSLHDQEAEDAAAGRNSIPPTFLARYMKHYEKLRAEGIDVEAALKLVGEEVEREQAATTRALFAQVPRRRGVI